MPVGAEPSPSEAIVRRALDQFRAALHSRSLKMTPVREAIVRAALGYEGHFEVEDLLRVLRAKGVPEAHLATIYRAMPLLVEAGLVQTALLSTGDGQRYEAAFERGHHDHLVCKGCGKVIEFYFEAMEALQRDIAERYDFELTEHVHELLGNCADCRGVAPRAQVGELPKERPESRDAGHALSDEAPGHLAQHAPAK